MTSLRGLTIGVIGAGTMGQALIKGLLDRGVSRSSLRAAEASAAMRRRVRRRFRVEVSGDNRAVARWADVIILAVKPQQLPGVAAQLAPHLAHRPLVISIAAGVRLRWLERRLAGVPLARVMPNLPATVGCAFSAVVFSRRAAPRHRAVTKLLFNSIGCAVELPERHLDAVTAVSGSGPAYVFFLVQAWEAAARSLGLPPGVVSQAVRQTLAGSVRLLEESGEAAAALIGQVASKGGTTEAALRLLARRRVHAHVVEAVRAAARRSKQLTVSDPSLKTA